MKMSYNNTSIKLTWSVNLKMVNSAEKLNLQAIASRKGYLWNTNNEKKPTLKNKKKENQPVSIRFNLQPSITKRRLELLQYVKEKLTAVKEIKFPYADMHGGLKVVLNAPIRNRYVLGLKQRKILVKFWNLWVLTIMKGYRMRYTKGFSFWKDH